MLRQQPIGFEWFLLDRTISFHFEFTLGLVLQFGVIWEGCMESINAPEQSRTLHTFDNRDIKEIGKSCKNDGEVNKTGTSNEAKEWIKIKCSCRNAQEQSERVTQLLKKQTL